MAKVVVFLDHEIMIRHFVKSGVFQPLERQHEVVYVFPEQHRRVTTNPADLDLPRFRLMPVSNERAFRWRRFYHATALRRARGSENQQFLFEFFRESLGGRAFLQSWILSWPLTNWFYRKRLLKRLGTNAALEALLSEERPDVVLHPTVLEGLFVSDLVRWGERHETPVAFLMNSWDNPSTKAMAIGYPDWLVVWGPQTKRHAVQHLGMPEDRILCFGAAQFDVYRDPPRESREEILERLGFSPHQKTLLYAGSSKRLNEVEHLQRLEEAIDQGVLPDCQILFRPHPWRGIIAGEADFFSVPWKYVRMDDQMAHYYRESREHATLIFTPDYGHTHAVLSAVDAVVSPVSTILLEAALHGKPILAYMPKEEIGENLFFKTMMNMNFMRDFFTQVDCRLCHSSSGFIEACRSLLRSCDDPSLSERLRQQTTYFIANPGTSYGEQLVSLVDRLVSRSEEPVEVAVHG